MFQKIAKHRANDASNDVHRPPLGGGCWKPVPNGMWEFYCEHKPLLRHLIVNISTTISITMAEFCLNSTSFSTGASLSWSSLVVKLRCVSISVRDCRHKTRFAINVIGYLSKERKRYDVSNKSWWNGMKKMRRQSHHWKDKSTVMSRPSASQTLYSPSTRPAE